MQRTLRLTATLLFAAAAAAPMVVHAKDPEKTPPPVREAVCGRDLMTPEELAEHRAKMWGAKTPAERDAYRAEQHAQMVKRAQERGVTLDPAGCPRGGGPPAVPPKP